MQEMNFEELLKDSLKKINQGDVISGTVISVHPSYAILNIGYKADGIIKNGDYSRDPSLDLTTVLKKGDELQVKVKKLNDGEGQVVLSRRELLQAEVNEKLKSYYESGNVQVGKVVSISNGGLLVEIEPEITVFIPRSLISNRPVDDLSKFSGQNVQFIITEFNPQRNRCIGDRKKLMIAEEKKRKEEALNRIKEGDIIEGIITNLLDYGAFVDIGGIDGLLHLSEMGWGKIKNPKKAFKVGDKIKVLVREIKNGKVSLTAKFPEDDPWLIARVNYQVGKTVKGKVVRIVEYGAFVALDEYIDALLHISEISWDKVKKVEDVLKVGEEITALVIDYNEADKRISLSMKQLTPKPEPIKEETKDVVDVDIEAYAKKINDNGEVVS